MTKILNKTGMAVIHAPAKKTAVNVDSIEGMTKEKDKLVTGTFINIEAQGQPAKVSGKYYKDMQYFSRVFEDGERATIPLSVARFINERCFYEKHGYMQDDKGQSIKDGKPIHRYKFLIEQAA